MPVSLLRTRPHGDSETQHRNGGCQGVESDEESVGEGYKWKLKYGDCDLHVFLFPQSIESQTLDSIGQPSLMEAVRWASKSQRLADWQVRS